MAPAKTKRFKPVARSRVSNGALLPRGVDGRSLWMRRFRDLIDLHLADLGGPNQVSASETAIIRRAATIIIALEQLEYKFAQAGDATHEQLEVYQRLANSMRRLLESVGLQRRSRDITPPRPLHEYLNGHSPHYVEAD